jgi:hypothetical protein
MDIHSANACWFEQLGLALARHLTILEDCSGAFKWRSARGLAVLKAKRVMKEFDLRKELILHHLLLSPLPIVELS